MVKFGVCSKKRSRSSRPPVILMVREPADGVGCDRLECHFLVSFNVRGAPRQPQEGAAAGGLSCCLYVALRRGLGVWKAKVIP
jgi:hypothetical protein